MLPEYTPTPTLPTPPLSGVYVPHTVWITHLCDPAKLADMASPTQRTDDAVLDAMREGIRGPVRISQVTGISKHFVTLSLRRLLASKAIVIVGKGASRSYVVAPP